MMATMIPTTPTMLLRMGGHANRAGNDAGGIADDGDAATTAAADDDFGTKFTMKHYGAFTPVPSNALCANFFFLFNY